MSQVLEYRVPGLARLEGLGGRQCVRPTTAEQVREALVGAGEGQVFHPLGGGVHAQALPAKEAVILDMRAMDRVLGWDPESCTVTVQAGVTIGALEAYLAGRGARLGWRPAHPEATVGGILSSWQPVGHALWNGSVREACVSLSAVTGEGQSYRYLVAPRKSSGPDLRHLFIGGQGRFGVITSATLGVTRQADVRRGVAWDEVAPEEAIDRLGLLFAQGLRTPWVVYSGQCQRLEVWFWGERAACEAAQAYVDGLAGQLLESPGGFDGWGTIRSGGDPLARRGMSDAGGAVIWGSLRDLKGLPAECWAQGVLYEVSAHQAAVHLPADAEVLEEMGVSAQNRSVWWDGRQVVKPKAASAKVMATGMSALKAALDPRGVLPSLSEGEVRS
mgnify:CR=1 FL=1